MEPGRTILYSSWLPESCGGKDIIAGMREELAFEGYQLNAPQTEPTTEAQRNAEERQRIQQCIADPKIAGLILMYIGDEENLALVSQLQASGKAVVFLDRMPDEDKNFDWVGVDNTLAARQVVEHLIQQGHRSIAHITTGENVGTVADRRRGYRQALTAAGLPYRPDMVVPHGNDWRGIAVPRELLQSLLCLPDPPTAIFALHDWAALFTMSTAHILGLRVPQELAVAGFDGIERLRYKRSLLTTAEVPFKREGVQAARLLMDRIEGRLRDGVHRVLLEAPLRVNFSTQKEASLSMLDESAWRSRLIYHYMDAHIDEDLTVECLAGVARVSVSTLFKDFERNGFQSPMIELRYLRLGQFHWELTHPSAKTTVFDCAVKCGLMHLGRAASIYKEIYGTLPSQTLKCALNSLRNSVTQ